MNLSIDWDDTYTRDPVTWNVIIQTLRNAGHKVYCVTWRVGDVSDKTLLGYHLEGLVDGIFFTGQQAKSEFMYAQGIHIDVWIDDLPFAVHTHGQAYLNRQQPPQDDE